MARPMPAQDAALIATAAHEVPRRKWHPNGYKVSIDSSLLMAAVIGLLFIAMAGWTPGGGWEATADFAVPWILLT